MIDRRAFVQTLAITVLSAPLAGEAQQRAGKIPRVGYLSTGPRGPNTDAFLQGLQDLGYVEGKDVAIEYRFAEGIERLPDLAGELVRLKVDVIVASATSGAQAAHQATKMIPIVMVAVGDPVASGLVAGLARPGGNVTGLSTLGPDLAGKRLQLLMEVTPELSRVAVLWNPLYEFSVLVMRQTEAGARMLGVQLQSLEVRAPDDFDYAFHAATRGHAGALIAAEDPFSFQHRRRIVELAARSRLPAMYGYREFVEGGGLMSFGASLPDIYRRAATHLDKILKGAKPADLPVELLGRADQVIE